jgi:DNA replication protein
MTTFAGFPTGKNPYVPVPEVFFTHILPQIQDSAELKVTLHLFWLLAKKQNQPRCISDRELQQDQLLLRSLRRAGDPRPAQERVLQGLEQAVVHSYVFICTWSTKSKMQIALSHGISLIRLVTRKLLQS